MQSSRWLSAALILGLLAPFPPAAEPAWWDFFKSKPAAPKTLEERAKEVGDVGIRTGGLSPDFELRKVGGGTLRLSSYRGEKAVVLNFWATWCPPCRKEMPSLEALSKAYADRGLVVLGVSIDVDDLKSSPAPTFLRKMGVTFPNVFDPKMRAAKKFAVHGLPVTYLIDRRGKIRKRIFGDRDWMSAKTRRMVERLLLTPDPSSQDSPSQDSPSQTSPRQVSTN